MNAKRYTQSQVLCGLREAWLDATGTDEPFDLDTQIYAFMKADGSWDDLDFADILWRLEQFFGFACSRQEWHEFFGYEIAKRSFDEWQQTVAPRLTFEALVQFIGDRAPVTASFEAIPVLGRHCEAAGVFTGIQQVADNVKGPGQRFAPSTPILDVLRGRDLDVFWTKLRWMTENSIAALPAVWRDALVFASCLGLLTILGGGAAAWGTSDGAWFVASLLGAVVLYVAAFFYKRLANPLPPHVVTFRDLSVLIAESRQASSGMHSPA